MNTDELFESAVTWCESHGIPLEPEQLDSLVRYLKVAILDAQEATKPLTQDQRRLIWDSVKYEGGDCWKFDFADVVDAVEAAHSIGAKKEQT